MSRIFTIGFTKKPARRFFELLERAGVRRIIDVRLHSLSQLAGFAKKEDIAYFAQALGGIDYAHALELAPTPDMLERYSAGLVDWQAYEREFLELMAQRRIEEAFTRQTLADNCLLCSEADPHQCHRRLVAEYLARQWGAVEVVHLT
jgi:uncharacterized protein (DUF488 family)